MISLKNVFHPICTASSSFNTFLGFLRGGTPSSRGRGAQSIIWLSLSAASPSTPISAKKIHFKSVIQESPPAWTQEAYRPPCSEYSFCCPNWVPSPPSWPGWGGTLPGGTLPGYPHPGPRGYPAGRVPYLCTPVLTWPGVPCQGVPYLGTPHPDLAGYPPTGPGWVPPPPVSAPWHSG